MELDERTQTERRRDLGEILLDAGLITLEQLETAQWDRQAGQSVADALVVQGDAASHDVVLALSLHLNLPFVDLKRHAVQPWEFLP